MSKYFVCCEKCFETIARRHTGASKLWMDLCARYLEKNGIFQIFEVYGSFHSDLYTSIQILENMGFLVSTETSIAINVKINGHILSSDGQHFFCRKGGFHD